MTSFATPLRLGVDVGGTKIAAALLDGDNRVLFKDRRPTPRHDYNGILATVAGLVEDAAATAPGADIPRIGVGIPGAMEQHSGLVKNANTQILIGKPLQQDLERRLGRKTVIANDATCFTTSEAADGAAAGAEAVFGIILGTGVGGGLAVGGKPVTGENSLAGEWGHNPFPYYGAAADNRRCYCGKTDCIELIISGTGFERDYSGLTGKPIKGDEIVAAAKQGDADAVKTLDRLYENVAKALSTVVNFADPNVIVIGGGLSNIENLYTEVPKRWGKYIFNASAEPAEVTTRLVQNKWGDDSGVRGAAWLT